MPSGCKSGSISTPQPLSCSLSQKAQMRPLYAVRIEDLGRGDLVKVDCAARQHVALLDALLRLG